MCAPNISIQMQGELCHKPRYAFIGLKGSAEELQLTASNLWALPSKDLEKDVQIDLKLLNSSSQLGFKVQQISKKLFGPQSRRTAWFAEWKQLGYYSGSHL